jgi:two-component system chemotaxis response regulator CheB
VRNYQAIVIGSSTGGLRALETIFSIIEKDFSLLIAVVQHVRDDSILATVLGQKSQLPVKDANDKEPFRPGMIYLAPPNYHLLIEQDGTFALSVDQKENYSRPSIDVLFESAADAFRENLIGVLLTGANADGALGMKKIRDQGGLTIVQDPKTAEAGEMPASALKLIQPDHILPVNEIGILLNSLSSQTRTQENKA